MSVLSRGQSWPPVPQLSLWRQWQPVWVWVGSPLQIGVWLEWDLLGVSGGEEEERVVRSGSGAARTILLFHSPSKRPLMVGSAVVSVLYLFSQKQKSAQRYVTQLHFLHTDCNQCVKPIFSGRPFPFGDGPIQESYRGPHWKLIFKVFVNGLFLQMTDWGRATGKVNFAWAISSDTSWTGVFTYRLNTNFVPESSGIDFQKPVYVQISTDINFNWYKFYRYQI